MHIPTTSGAAKLSPASERAKILVRSQNFGSLVFFLLFHFSSRSPCRLYLATIPMDDHSEVLGDCSIYPSLNITIIKQLCHEKG